jgi:hypothetical protein
VRGSKSGVDRPNEKNNKRAASNEKTSYKSVAVERRTRQGKEQQREPCDDAIRKEKAKVTGGDDCPP